MKTFPGGIHPLKKEQEGKLLTRNERIRPLLPDKVVIPMGMHLGAPSKPIVNVGDTVKTGQLIAEPVGGLGLPVHASISGRVSAVEPRQQLKASREMCIEIEGDMRDDWVELTPLNDAESVPAEAILPAVKAAGICGMGGAAFPTHIKMSIPEGKYADTVILNGAECEPYLTADHRLMLERPEQIVDGLRLIMRATGVTRGVIAIEENKPDAIQVVMAAAKGREGVEVRPLVTKYPQGSEKQLIHVITGRMVPRKKLPIDAGALVFNVSTAAAVAQAVLQGRPLISRITTVSGCVNRPGNLELRIGTTFEEAVAQCGGLAPGAKMILAGGPMTAPCAPDLSVSIGKASGGIVIFDEAQARTHQEGPCMRCGRCVEACPIGLYPFLIKYDVDRRELDAAVGHGLLDCILCGACSYSCPAHRYLTATCKAGKEAVAARGKR